MALFNNIYDVLSWDRDKAKVVNRLPWVLQMTAEES